MSPFGCFLSHSHHRFKYNGHQVGVEVNHLMSMRPQVIAANLLPLKVPRNMLEVSLEGMSCTLLPEKVRPGKEDGACMMVFHGSAKCCCSTVDRRIYREIMDYWAKAEAVKDSDKMVALLLYKKTYGGWACSRPAVLSYNYSCLLCVCVGLIQSLKFGEQHNLREPVKTGLDQLQHRCETAMSELKVAMSPSQVRSKCSSCGQLRRVKAGLCKPCELRRMIRQ